MKICAKLSLVVITLLVVLLALSSVGFVIIRRGQLLDDELYTRREHVVETANAIQEQISGTHDLLETIADLESVRLTIEQMPTRFNEGSFRAAPVFDQFLSNIGAFVRDRV